MYNSLSLYLSLSLQLFIYLSIYLSIFQSLSLALLHIVSPALSFVVREASLSEKPLSHSISQEYFNNYYHPLIYIILFDSNVEINTNNAVVSLDEIN